MTTTPGPHFARPVHFGGEEDCDCAICKQPITLYTNPDGRRVWIHVLEMSDDGIETPPPSEPLLDDIDVKRLRLKPNDIVVVKVDRDLTEQDAMYIKARVEAHVAPHRVMIISRDVVIEVMEPDDG